MRKKLLTKYIKLINFWPPYIGAGIKIKEVNPERTHFRISMRLTWRNKNLFGTQFGGSLYAMTDPFYAFILVLNLGREYIVWDKSARIEYKKPGKSKVFADITIDPKRISEIKEELNSIGKSTYTFSTQIVDKNGEVIAVVNKELYIRLKSFNKNEK